ncbi:DUF6701 domain-containing protein [Marinobacter sediminum]|uniref:DUF6701 domain-containing protein n=2 Tax=Marinobacter sediminum TaxID=256323 RepID=UPI003564B078
MLALLPVSILADEYCDAINGLADYGIIGESGFTSGNNSTINGEDIQCPPDDNDCTGNTPTPSGQLETVDEDFPALEPATFPTTGGQNLTNPKNLQSGSYGTISVASQGKSDPLATFSGGTYKITELDLSGNDSTVILSAGDYFIDTLTMDNKSRIETTGGTVRLFIGTSMTSGNQTFLNADGAVSDFIVNLYPGASFKLGNGEKGKSDINFNGILYAPYPDTTIDFGNNNDITGAILSAGTVNVGNNTSFDYSEDVQNEVRNSFGCEEVTEPDHVRISHDGQTSACAPQALLVQACADADCSVFFNGAINGTVQAGENQVDWSLAENSDSTSVNLFIPFDGDQAGDSQTLSFTTPDPTPLICSNTSSGETNIGSACEVTVTRAGFAFDIPDFVSATAQTNVVIAATRLDENQECTPLFANKDRTLALSQTYLDPGVGSQSLQIDGSIIPSEMALNFDNNGRATIASVNYLDAGRMALALRYEGSEKNGDAGTVVIGSDNFAVRPDRFEFTDILCSSGSTVTMAPGEPGGLSAFCRAGEDFSLTVQAVNAAGNVTPNFGREASPESATLSHTLTLPSGGNSGALAVPNVLTFGTSDGSPPGIAQVNGLRWNEVGVLTIEADNANYLSSVGAVNGTSSPIGRFVPAFFTAAPSEPELLPYCGSFSYQGQPMDFDLPPQVILQARNLTGGATANYRNEFFRYVSPSLGSLTYTADTAPASIAITPETPRGSLDLVADIDTTTAGYDGHALTLNGEQLAFSRDATPPSGSPFTSTVSLSISATALTDADGVCVRDNATDTDCNTALFDTMPAPQQRYGRLVLDNVYGPENINLPIPVRTEYWDGNAFVTNAADSCTFVGTTIDITADPDNLNPSTGGSGGGLANGLLSANDLYWEPAGAVGNVRYRYTNTPTWLQFDWDASGTPRAPDAVVSFGRYRGHDRIISWEEL